MRQGKIWLGLVTLATLLGVGWLLWQQDMAALKTMIVAWGTWGYFLYVGAIVASVVLAPFTVFPIIPFASHIFGPFLTALLTICGWTVGALIAFLIARLAGRPLLSRFIDLSRADAIAAALPPRQQFFAIFIMRHLMPVEVVSYGLGLIPTVSLPVYLLATLLGVIWFAFALSYLGEAAFAHNIQLLALLGFVSLAIFVGGWYLLGRLKKSHL